MIEPLLKSQLEPVARRQRQWRGDRALLAGWAALALAGVVLLFLQRSSAWPGHLTVPLFLLAGLAVTVAAWRWAGRWQPDYRDIARRIEQKHPALHALLLTAVEQQPDPATGQFHFLQQRVLNEALAESRKHQWVEAVPGGRLIAVRLGRWAALAACIWLLIQLGTGPVVPAAPGLAAAAAKSAVAVTPGDTTVERGSGLVVLARFTGPVPGEVVLVTGATAGNSRRIPLTRSLADPVFGGSLTEVNSNLLYRVEYAGQQTRDFQVTVFDYPALKRSDARIVYPEYTTLPEKRIQETRRVSAVEGSKLDFTLQLNKPVASARLIAKDKTVVPLKVETNKPLASLENFPLLASGTYELQLVDDEGRTNKVPAQFVLEAQKNRAPELKVLAPRGDQRVSPLQEVSFSGEVWDDFGLRDYGLTYTIAGTEPKSLSLGAPTAPNQKTNLNHLLKLEELRVQPDQLLSWFIWADDIGPDGKVRRTASDMYFAEVRPFDEIFREGQGAEKPPGESPGGAGEQAAKLAELQKQIINATWKLQRTQTAQTLSTQYRKDAPVVLQSQEKAKEQAEALQERASDPRVQTLIENVIKEMDGAIGHLTAATNAPRSSAVIRPLLLPISCSISAAVAPP